MMMPAAGTRRVVCSSERFRPWPPSFHPREKKLFPILLIVQLQFLQITFSIHTLIGDHVVKTITIFFVAGYLIVEASRDDSVLTD